jgi:MarR family transcriptional regulator, organic hydroperoxide resistance regulator
MPSKPRLSSTQINARNKFVSPLTISRKDLLKNGSDDWLRDVIYRLVQALGRLTTCREAFGRQIDLTSSQFAVLIGVAYRQGDEGIPIANLAGYIGLAATHVTTEVGRLTRKGLLRKRPNGRDGRSVLISLSPEGERAINEVAPFVRHINDLLFAGIDRSEIEAVRTFAENLIRNSEYALVEMRVAEASRKSASTPPPRRQKQA